jgi:hypothetical protein
MTRQMGGDRQAPGKGSRLSPDDIASAPDIGALKPGKGTLIQTYDVGDDWIDHGQYCDDKDEQTPGCFLRLDQRERLVQKIYVLGGLAAGNYKDALNALRVKRLLERDADLPWVASLAIELIGAHAIKQLARALQGVRSSALAKVEEAALRAGEAGAYAGPGRWERALNAVTGDGIDRSVKLGVDAAKRQATSRLKGVLGAPAATARGVTLSYLEQLLREADAGYLTMLTAASAHARDAELVVLFHAMDPVHHAQPLYEAALSEKLARFDRSGVREIGRTQTTDPELHRAEIHRDRRVVWVQFANGVKSLWYQVQDGDFHPTYMRPGDPGTPYEGPQRFGARHPREAAHLDAAVPDEFRDAALARSEQQWGPTPTIEDPTIANLRAIGYDPKPAAGPPLPRVDLGKVRTP